MDKLLEQDTKRSVFKILNTIKITTISALILAVFLVAFLQVYFDKESPAVVKAQKVYTTVENARIVVDENLKTCLNEFQSGKISEEYLHSEIANQTMLLLNLEKESASFKEQLELVKQKDKVFGFRSIKIFFGHLGMPAVASMLGLYLLILFFKEEDLFFKKVTLSFSIAGLVTGLFYVTWVFYPSPDIPQWAYILLLLLFSVSGTILAFFVGSYLYKLSQLSLVIKIQNLLSYITFDIKRKYISKQDRQEYISDYLGEIEKLSKK
ncbi:hypothetical protein [Aquimarina sp. RZ0]|uniref:hypothetical protein n=1 Tax=Aquimarina sp. RZ0 TaxID=2607730 RepID=UPI0011F30713|nr:hypothetical protein [Aquimarina sp. RZ0]KAA1244497.1 hypothetical protein F0000_16045 [Aquimarina sp. RZ0]